jgi:lipoprotein-anchoring transpeptidase ErfK/SrfK
MPTERDWVARAFAAAARKGLPQDGVLLLVSVEDQAMLAANAGRVTHRYRVSTSRFGIGSRENSYRTPLGMHRVAERYGADEPAGRVFRARRPTREVVPEAQWRSAGSKDLVMTRILRLAGLTPNLNRGGRKDSFRRCIYIHGTNQEHLLGRPASHGCIRMGNRDVIALAEHTAGRETWCCILRRFPASG